MRMLFGAMTKRQQTFSATFSLSHTNHQPTGITNIFFQLGSVGRPALPTSSWTAPVLYESEGMGSNTGKDFYLHISFESLQSI